MVKKDDSLLLDGVVKEADAKLLKEMGKLMHRIERVFVSSDSITFNPTVEKLSQLTKMVQQGKYLADVKEFSKANVLNVLSKNSELVLRKVDWSEFQKDLLQLVSNGEADYVMPNEVYEEIGREVQVHEDRLEKARKKEKLRHMQFRNNQPIIAGKWRKEPYPPREYTKLDTYIMTESISPTEATHLAEQLQTPLNGYLGQSYNYDDHTLTEEWMLTYKDKKTAGPTGDDVIKQQLGSLLDIMIATVQDRVCTELGVLEQEPLVLGKDVKEIPVWGIDCYTRTMIELAITERATADSVSRATVKHFIERVLLPSVNAQVPQNAHDMKVALMDIQAQHPDTQISAFAGYVLQALHEFGSEHFRIHPKGTGVVCITPEGIPAHVLVTMYLGEVYPPYRWCERLDVIEQAQHHFELKPTLPDFYNILLERPRSDPRGYGLLYVDASQKANIGSSCSHSCDSNCTSAVVARQGKLTIALTTNRHIHYGEELTMDYFSITTSDVEWRAAICLCGMTTCRGSFLHYATQDDLQQVLNQNFGPALRYASLLRACTGKSMCKEDVDVLVRHGVQDVAIGCSPPIWIKKYVVDILRFIEYERKALPCALLRRHGASYSFGAADMEARCIMEQRIQSMVCCISMVNKVLSLQSAQVVAVDGNSGSTDYPLVPCSVSEVVQHVWSKFLAIPQLLSTHMLKEKSLESLKGRVAQVIKDVEQVLGQATPVGFHSLREKGIEIREILLTIEDISCSKARIGQLADLIVLWAFTTNFSKPKEYASVESDSISVPARELGANVPRAKVFKPTKPLRSNQSKDRANQVVNNTAPVSETVDRREGCVDCTVEDVMDVSIEANTTIESVDSPRSDLAATIDVNVIIETDSTASSSSVAEDVQEEDVVAMEVDSSACIVQDSMLRQTSTNVGCDPVDLDSNVNRFSQVISSKTVASSNGMAEAKNKLSPILSPNEPVFSGKMVYPPLFCFWQLIGWFSAGTDQKADKPDLFGCVQLPSINCCFGVSDTAYGDIQRKQLLELLSDEKQQIMPWTKTLKNSFNLTAVSVDEVLCGSPMLDVALGQVDAVKKVLKHLIRQDDIKSGKKKGVSRFSRKDESMQLDNVLPPEMPTSWVQCEGCKKWRRVPWHVDADSLSEEWQCNMNSWDVENATCEAPQDSFDPATENTVQYSGDIEIQEVKIEDFKIGEWRDVFCLRNKVYYEGQVKRIKPPTKKKKNQLLFHYRGWSSSFDEWVEFDSDRIAPHHLYTNPDTTDPREQEVWQGREPVQSVIRSAVGLNAAANPSGTKRRKSEESASANKSPRIEGDVEREEAAIVG